jgi:hypothetical protein
MRTGISKIARGTTTARGQAERVLIVGIACRSATKAPTTSTQPPILVAQQQHLKTSLELARVLSLACVHSRIRETLPDGDSTWGEKNRLLLDAAFSNGIESFYRNFLYFNLRTGTNFSHLLDLKLVVDSVCIISK